MDNLYLKRALELAELGAGYNAPNPRVGAVIVYQNRIIGEGYHQQYGQAHAEVNAVANVAKVDKKYLRKATIYVTLEPCFHYGKTPPCVDLILQNKIPRVVISCIDSFAAVAGQSVEKLRAAGVEVTVGVLEKEGLHLARRFFTTIHQKRPFIVLKFAQSADGFIGKEGEEVAISSAICKRAVHGWRSKEAAILVGTNTALVDNPRLDNRHYWGASPLRLVIDRDLRLPQNLHLFDGSNPTWVFTEKTEFPRLKNVRFVSLHLQSNGLKNILEYLQKQKIQSILVEGGRQLLQSFLDSSLWDECRIIDSPIKLYSGIAAPRVNPSLLEEQSLLDGHRLLFYKNNS